MNTNNHECLGSDSHQKRPPFLRPVSICIYWASLLDRLSMLIIQDDNNNWQLEAAKMGDI